jgi:hypothetical protein
MLGKLLKYEIKATARLFLPLYLTLIIFTVINSFLLFIPNAGENSFSFYGFLTTISMIIYVTLMIGLVAMTLIVMIQRFYKNLLGDEGYLMFTLPVKSWNHILSKLTISILWTVTSGIVAFFSIMFISSKNISIPELLNMFSRAFDSFIQYFGASAYLISLEFIVLGLLSIASTILVIYAAIALGHLFNKYKLLASFGMYIALQTVSQIIMSLSAAIFFNQDIFRPGTPFIPSATLVTGILLIGILYYGVFCAGYFALTNYILKRKLNLE